uniref:Uncharacterized protein n=1 Tax=Chromera velia CCMP2878 TaxID=1169474 RepID=A0A0G4IDM8_9ALVE|eukprot:Cvel_13333.t1-p1 / transcript=Cvel_13333.t1 / gene=Cvel_13333 / organism=Chromera_velia_CCMP2878 / gene_product=hypothetical protein / transcript_product=hypothetical protein / location=Cvel_scaffold905:56059-57135(+) / protein_length=115 / sequence_SO=supercontig / SO=protein_coding / is_pseudo=false
MELRGRRCKDFFFLRGRRCKDGSRVLTALENILYLTRQGPLRFMYGYLLRYRSTVETVFGGAFICASTKKILFEKTTDPVEEETTGAGSVDGFGEHSLPGKACRGFFGLRTATVF